MDHTKQIADQFRQSFLGPNWTAVALKEQVGDISFVEANRQIYGLNSILALFFHINYYINGVLDFFENGKLEIRDKFSFDYPDIQSDEEWEKMKQNSWKNMEAFASKLSSLPDDILSEPFFDEKYGSYYKNLLGNLEHIYYHLGQIAIIKKIIRNQS